MQPAKTILLRCSLLVLALAGVAQAQDAELQQLKQQFFKLCDSGEFLKAAAVSERAVGLCEAQRGLDPITFPSWLNNVGFSYVQAGRPKEALPPLERALEISRKSFGEEHYLTAKIYDNQGAAHWNLGHYTDAEAIYKRSLAIRERVLGPGDIAVAQSLNNLALVYQDQGRYAEAEPILQRVIVLAEKIHGVGHRNTSRPIHNLAGLYSDMGRYAEAELLFRKVTAIRETSLGKNHPDVAQGIAQLAMLYSAQSRFTEAESHFCRALELQAGDDSLGTAITLNSLAFMYINQGRLAEARTLLTSALKIREEQLGPEAPTVAQSLNNLARVSLEEGQLDQAEQLQARALAMREKLLGKNHPTVAISLCDMARLAEKRNQLSQAEALLTRAIELRDQAAVEPLDRFQSYSQRAQVFWQLKRRSEAMADLATALGLVESARGDASGGDTERAEMFANYAGAYERMVAWQIELGQADQALATIERSRARSLMDQLATTNVDFLAGLPADEAAALRQSQRLAQRQLAELEKQAELSPDATSLEAPLKAARQAAVDAAVAIRNASPAYRQMVGQNFQPVAATEIQAKLAGEDGLLLEYLLGDEAGYVVVIPPTGGKLRVEPLTITAEQAAVLKVDAGPLTASRMRGILATADGTGVLQQLRLPSVSKSLIDRLAVLWQVLVPSTERQLLTSGKLKHWTIIPDAALAAFPFETLVVEKGEDLRYVLDVAPPLNTSPSATLLMNLANGKPADAKGVLSVGDVSYGAPAEMGTSRGAALRTVAAGSRYVSSRGSLQPLPYTATESKWVTDTFKQAGLTTGALLKQNARENSVRTFGPNYEILHLACHGLVDQGHGNLFGALALTPGPSGASTPSDDGFLTLQEIYALNLHGTRLAILSACDTNYGPQQRGEGVWSLSRGFLVAGAQRVVASNWLVDDEAAATLIAAFCGSIAKGQKAGSVDYAVSLHNAKRYIREQEKWQAPYYWGTFVLIGPGK